MFELISDESGRMSNRAGPASRFICANQLILGLKRNSYVHLGSGVVQIRDLHLAAVSRDYPVADGEAEAGSPTGWLCRKEWIKDMF